MGADLPILMDPIELSHHTGDRTVLVVDATVDLARTPEGEAYTIASGQSAYASEHLPGAVFADLIEGFSDRASEWPFSLPSPARFAAAADALEIGPGVRVVIYTQKMPQLATRLWWLLRALRLRCGRRAGWWPARLARRRVAGERRAGVVVSAHVRARPKGRTAGAARRRDYALASTCHQPICMKVLLSSHQIGRLP